jgi:hypothetical protein
MNLIKKFFERRSQNLSQKNKINEVPEEEIQNKIDKNRELTDDDFWYILKQYQEKTKENSDKKPDEILEEILEPYSSKQIMQFVKRYEKLNK